jgi:gliding motility-associated-like protein
MLKFQKQSISDHSFLFESVIFESLGVKDLPYRIMYRWLTIFFLLLFVGIITPAQQLSGQQSTQLSVAFPANVKSENEQDKKSNRNTLNRESIQLLNDTLPDCAGPTPRTIYWSEKGSFKVINTIRSKDGGFFIACDFVSYTQNIPVQPLIIKMDVSSNINWICPIKGNESFGFTGATLLELSDGALLVSSGIAKGEMDMEALVIKISPAGAILWSQSFRSSSGTCQTKMTFFLSFLKELPGGDLVAAGNVNHCMDWPSGVSNASIPVVVKLSSDGKILWSKSFGSETDTEPMYMTTIGLLATAEKISLITTSDFNRLVAWKFDMAIQGSSAVTTNKTEPESINAAFIGTELSPNSLSVIRLASGKIRISSPTIGLNLTSSDPTSQFGVLDLAEDFSTSEYRVLYAGFPYTEQARFKNINLQPNGLMDFSMPNRSQQNPLYYLSNFESNGLPVKQREIISHIDRTNTSITLPNQSSMQHLVQSAGKFLGITPLGLQDANSECIGKDTALLFWGDAKVAYEGSQETPPMISENAISQTTNAITKDISPDIKMVNVCRAFNFCNTLTILNTDTTTCNSSKVNLKASLNAACDAQVFWRAQFPDSADMVPNSNNEVEIQLKGKYNGWIYAEINGACGILRDSIKLSIENYLPPLDLGSDLLFCPGRLNHLVATPGYKSYIWNNNSTADTLVIYTGGNYWVTAIDYCGNTFSDSINVLPFLNLPFTAGENFSICAGDTTTLMAAKDYTNYRWEPNDGMQFSTSANPRVSPLQTTTYRVRTLAGPDCLLIDSVTVFVQYPTPFSLGPDVTVCSGETTVFNGPFGFKRFIWNKGDTTRGIQVNKPGPYILKAAPDDGCLYTDTLNLFNFPRPFEPWDKNPVLCGGEAMILNAGTNLNQIIWSDGTNGPTLTVDKPGTYWVQVTDTYNCIYEDTITITHLKPSPANFLPADSTICSYATWPVNALQPYAAYLWSTGETTRGITIKDAGVYSLKVTDSEGCAGEEQLKVMVEKCPEGLFVPTAFTPNGDGNNDVFRATLLGQIQSFEFSIYNRFGELIFKTKDMQSGWPGTLKGKPLPSGTFIWQCKYQLQGGPVEMQKGTFLLIR